MGDGIRRIAASVALVGLGTAGCSPVSLNSARDLAQTGQAGVAAFQSTYESGVTGAERMNEYRAIRAHLGGPGDAAGDRWPSTAQLATIRQHLNARINVLRALNRSYGAFHDLAAFGSESDLQAALQGLRDAVGAAGGAVAGPAGGTVAGAIADPVVTVGGLIADERQKRRVYRASVSIQHELRRFLAITQSEQEIEEVVSVLLPVHAARLQILQGMWADRMISAAPMFREFVDNSTFALIEPSSPVLTNANRRVDAVVQERFASQRRELRARIIDVYEGHRALFRNLIDEHQRLQDGEALDAARLHSYSTHIASLLEKLQVLAGQPIIRRNEQR